MKELILEHMASHVSIEEDDAICIKGLLKRRSVIKKELVLRESELCRDIFFVLSGTLRAFYIDGTGRETTVMFATSGWWITDMLCFVNQQSAMLNIESLEDSELLSLSKTDMDMLLNEKPKFERYFRILMQNAYIREQLRVIQNLSLTAEERYGLFVKKYPGVAHHVTQKQIASYLGITPEFLSVIRRNMRSR